MWLGDNGCCGDSEKYRKSFEEKYQGNIGCC
jgi:hypothetical protein